MFGTKFKIWMENHIGRPKKKSQPEKIKQIQNGGRGVILESSESLAHSDTGVSSGSQQVLSSSVTDPKENGYCTTTLESERSGMTQCLTAISLPSPESAYSTGYSTDGNSPGGTGPPEYYINIRTGKHYFPSPAPTPTSPQPNSTFSPLHSGSHLYATSFLINESSSLPPVSGVPIHPGSLQKGASPASPACIRSRFPANRSNGCPLALGTFGTETLTSRTGAGVKSKGLSSSVPSHFEIFNSSKSPCKKSQLSSLKLFLKSPKTDKGKEKEKGVMDVDKTPSFEGKKKVFSPTKTKKWYKQPFQKFGHKRTEQPVEASNSKTETKKDVVFEKNLYYLTKENAASPRQRNRIKTNPWLPTEPMSSQNFQSLQINFSPCLAPRNRSCTNTPLQNRKTGNVVQTKLKEGNARHEEAKNYLGNSENVVSRLGAGRQVYLELSDHSEEDLTLNEMMGTYNESYVYEKETDILSDSDPTDCEDYVSDSEADNGGDEQDSHDDELDFIDNGSVTEKDDAFAGNTGRCTYHDVYLKKNSFLFKGDRHHFRKESDPRKSFRRDKDGKGRKPKEEKRRRTIRRSFKCEEEEDSRKRPEVAKINPKFELNENVGGLNLSRVLMQRMMAKNGSKSADGTPVSIRRQNLIKELRESHIGKDQKKPETDKRLNGLKGGSYLVDIEGDRKYKELITEAENMYKSMQNSPIVQNRRKMLGLTTNENLENPIESSGSRKSTRNREEPGCPAVDASNSHDSPTSTFTRKSPKHLGLKLRMDEPPKNLENFDPVKENKNGLRARSSAHSPLDPLGPTFRNFTVFKPVNIDDEKLSLSSSEESDFRKPQERGKHPAPEPNLPNMAESPIVPIAFQSIDLGKPLMSYCPLSEPVKRKIYTCSKTYDKLVKTFENGPKVFEETPNGPVRHGSLMTKNQKEGVQTRYRRLKQSPNSYSSRREPEPNRGFSPNPPIRQLLCTEPFR